ncbi:sensor histidine kinase [Streptomyces gulbargensis]|uniref:histidine kinase n=1 Tax=Streptomyces gulbargensis TaxID=364901 RepID=A0ABP7LC76_9ACTN
MQEGRGRTLSDPLVVDSALACVLAAVTIVYARQGYEAQYRAEGWPPFGALACALSLAVNLPLALRRRAPHVAFTASCGALLTYTAGGFQPSVNLWAPLLACYSVLAARPARQAAWTAALTAGAWVASGLAARLSLEMSLAQAVIGVGIVWAYAGANRRLAQRNARLAALAQQRREQELRARHALTEERLRIARELHDVVAHHLSALAVQAGLADFVFDSDPAAARSAVVSIGTSTRQALDEMRGLLQVLRADNTLIDNDQLYHPSPGLQRLDELVERTRAAGLHVTAAVTGPARPLPSGVDLCAFRILQEALTNAVKHAGRGAHVDVDVAYGRDHLTGRVSDEGRGTPPADVPSNGLGLIGMRERARLCGGSLRAGPRAEGGFEVSFTIPLAPMTTSGDG